VASHPERLKFIYFNTVLLLRATARIGPYLTAYDYCTGDRSDDEAVLRIVENIVRISKSVGKFDETVLFRGENANILKAEFKDHFRNVSRIMDCVGCDKCRLWGKIQTTGLGVAMKILFELDENALDPLANPHLLQRTEVVALMNTLHRFSESLQAFDRFRDMWADEENSHVQNSSGQDDCSSSYSFSCLLWKIRQKGSELFSVCEQSVHICFQFFVDVMKAIRSLSNQKQSIPRPDL